MEKFDEYTSIKYWMESLAKRSEVTRKSYLKHMRAFCKAIGKTPDELIAQRKEDLKSDDLYVRHRIEMTLKKHIADLEKEGKSTGTQQQRYASIKSFFDCHYARLELLRTDYPSGESIGKEPADRKQIKLMMDVADPLQYRAMIAFLKDCGWRLGDVLKLKKGDITDLGDGYWNFKKLTQKRRVVANSFVGPEATELMTLYLQKREKAGEKITDESPLFLSEKGGFHKNVPWVSAKISQIAQAVGAKNVSAHSLRKYFQNTLENPDLHIQKSWIKQFIGKKLSSEDAPYVEHRTENLFEAYKKAYDYLRVLQPITPRVRPEDLRRAFLEEVPDEKLEPYAKKFGITIGEARRMLIREKKAFDTWQEMKEKTETNGGDCGEEYLQIPESELLSHLRQGYTIVHRLENGEVIVRR